MSDIALLETVVVVLLATGLLVVGAFYVMHRWGCPHGGWHEWKAHETAHGSDYTRCKKCGLSKEE